MQPLSLDALLQSSATSQRQGVRVGVIDTGIDQAAVEQWGYTRPLEGAVFANGQSSSLPYTGLSSAPHGTAVARIILKHAPQVELVSADVFAGSGQCDVENLIKAIHWCLESARCQVLNLSLGITEDRLLPVQRRWQLQRIIDECYHRHVTVVAAAHNDHPQYRSFPALLGAPLIGVCQGPWHEELRVEYQPCERVEFRATSSCEGDFLTKTTASSWAAPHVTAIVARLLSQEKDLRPFEVKARLRAMGK